MKELRYTRQFTKDLKRFLGNPEKLNKLNLVLDMLRNEKPLPKEYRMHPLNSEYTACSECHIEGDFLLIWYDEENDTLALFRLGSHSELFRK